ncbi:MAG: DUF1360 domain-containing protein [Actinomycetota bacterium]|nr:DUF1360 domain-containing protein [Actinomycetota bacterium]
MVSRPAPAGTDCTTLRMEGRWPLTMLRTWIREQAETYRHGEDRPLDGYLTLMSLYASGSLVASVTARAAGRTAPALSPWDVAQLAVATHKVSRRIAKDPVTSPFRAPFATYEGPSAPGELREDVRGHGLQHSVGELLTCPMCLGQWVATAFVFGLIAAPGPVRLMMSTSPPSQAPTSCNTHTSRPNSWVSADLT